MIISCTRQSILSWQSTCNKGFYRFTIARVMAFFLHVKYVRIFLEFVPLTFLTEYGRQNGKIIVIFIFEKHLFNNRSQYEQHNYIIFCDRSIQTQFYKTTIFLLVVEVLFYYLIFDELFEINVYHRFKTSIYIY